MNEKWNIRYRPKEQSMVVEEMSEADVAKYFPEHRREELTGSFKTIDVAPELVDVVLNRAAHS